MNAAAPSFTEFIIGMALGAWILGFALFFSLRRYYLHRISHTEHGTKEELLNDLANAFAPLQSITLQTSTEYLPFIFERIRENITSGFNDKQVLPLLERIDHANPRLTSHAVFHVEINGKVVDLRLEWTCDKANRIHLVVTSAPAIIKALRQQRKQVPRTASLRN